MAAIDLNPADEAPAPGRAAKLYRAAWRWHFYAGLFVVPFFIILAVTGMMMLWIAHIGGRDGERIAVVPQGEPAAISAQAEAAAAAVPDGAVVQYVAPRAPDLAAIFRVDGPDGPQMVVVDPYRAQAITDFPRRSGWYDLADNIHGELLIGVTGDRIIEIAASLGIVLLITGLYLWWPREGGVIRAFVPRLAARGRSLWKSLHAVTGVWVSLFLLFFLISGLAWAGVWGGKMVQPWSSFPIEKSKQVPLSDVTHASMNSGPKTVPWALEQVPMPASGSHAGHEGATGLVAGPESLADIDRIDAMAREIGFQGRYQLNLPKGETGVWTLSRSSMSTDSPDPMSDRTVHIDRYTGNILADIGYADYSWMGKAMAVGIALHMGTLGLWSVLANTLICLTVIFICVSGVVMWWKRRPAGQSRLAAPPLPADMPLWQGAVAIALVVSLAFPMAGLTLIGVMALDLLLLSRMPGLRRVLN